MSRFTRIACWLIPWFPMLLVTLFVLDRYERRQITTHDWMGMAAPDGPPPASLEFKIATLALALATLLFVAAIFLLAWSGIGKIRRERIRSICKRTIYALVVAISLFLVALAMLMFLDWWSGDTFFNSVLKGWVSFIFARLVALTLVALSLRRLWQSFPRIAASVIGIAILALAAFTTFKSFSPDGIYGFVGEIEPSNEFPEFRAIYHKDHFWRISGGKIYECYGDLYREYVRCEKRRDGWVLLERKTEHPPYWTKLEFSVFGFRMISVNGPGEFYPRRVIPFRRPFWMPQWLQ
jgi:hypothetical protein